MPLSTFLNGKTPTQLRGLQWLSLSDVGNVGTKTVTDDAGGGASYIWNFGTAVPCRVDPLADDSTTDVVAGRLDERSTHLVTVPIGTDVGTSDRFRITNRGTFEVTALRERTEEWAKTFEVVPAS